MVTRSPKHVTSAIILLVISLGVLTACVKGESETTTVPTQAQPETFSKPLSKPNMILTVKRQAGVCPQTVGIWTFLLPYEGGAEHTAVADTLPIAQTARLVASGNNFVEYEAPLLDNYQTCVGSADSKSPDVYSFRFQNRKVYFRVALDPGKYPFSKIPGQGIGGFRPYVRWNVEN